jgi:hypothetical protein
LDPDLTSGQLKVLAENVSRELVKTLPVWNVAGCEVATHAQVMVQQLKIKRTISFQI